MAETRAYKRLKKLHPTAHWQRFESWSGVGVFDCNACKNGVEIWVENKEVKPIKYLKDTWNVKTKVRKSQIAWEAQKRGAGGRTYVAIIMGKDLFVIPGVNLAELRDGMTYYRLNQLTLDPKRLFEW